MMVMDDLIRLAKNRDFAKQAEPIMTKLFGGNFIAGQRAAGSAIITVEYKGDGQYKWAVRMLTNRGNPTLPIGKAVRWVVSGGAVIGSTVMAVQFVLGAFGIDFEEFCGKIRLPEKIGQKIVYELKQIVEMFELNEVIS